MEFVWKASDAQPVGLTWNQSVWAQAGMFRLSFIWPLWNYRPCGWSCAGLSQVSAKLVRDWAVPGLALLGVRKKHIALDWECITWEAGLSWGGQKYSLAAAGNTLSWPSHTFDLFLVHVDLGKQDVFTCPWSQLLCSTITHTPAVPWGWWPQLSSSRPAQFCAWSLSWWCIPSHLPSQWLTSAVLHLPGSSQWGRLRTWPGPHRPFCCSVFGFSPFLAVHPFLDVPPTNPTPQGSCGSTS